MLLGAKRQVFLSITVVLLLLGISWFNFQLYHNGFRIPQHIFEHSSSNAVHDESNLATVLRPQDHMHREPKTIHHSWNITTGVRAPDGVTKQVYLINGGFPGPMIETRSGDELIVEVYNGLESEDTAIHWHGLEMRDANAMDGVVGLTQSPIRPGETFTYRFKISDDQTGTFWYHAHSELQRADGVYGTMIIHEGASAGKSEAEMFGYGEDLALMVGDWYHRSAQQVQDYYKDWTNFGNEPAPDSMLLNGQGKFNCSMAVPARPVKCIEVVAPSLRMKGGRTRLRIINTGALTGFTLSMTGHAMTVIKVDGGNNMALARAADSIGILYPGERIDIIVERLDSDDLEDLFLTIKLDKENLKFKNFALTPTQHFPMSTGPSSGQVPNKQEPVPHFNLADAKSPGLAAKTLATTTTQTLLLYTKVEILAEYSNIPKGFINRTSWSEPSPTEPPLLQTPRKDWDDRFIPRIERDGWVDIVLNNMDEKGHPFHLHGNNFFVLASHKGQPGRYQIYNPFEDPEPPGGPLNLVNPVKKDTVYVPGMGYVVLRFKADNAGLWFFHCHVLWHHSVGMGMAVQAGDETVSPNIGTRTEAIEGEDHH
ncbi:hypothetical protein BDZ45DRAFT_680586 [Acephala macrosclerotiorum]|nr:hypothetical protein BDZ45DRAFT_680586 [Acephala macrosclerotiorum]